MKVYVAVDPGLSRAMDRVEAALVRYLPLGSHVVKTREEADLEVLHVIGYPETAKRAYEATVAGRKYALIQYCLRTTQEPKTTTWAPLWEAATVVWSYYDLGRLWRQDTSKMLAFEHYYAPLGIDSAFWKMTEQKTRPYLLTATGYVAESECLKECALGVSQQRGKMMHIGPCDLKLGKHVTSKLGISDDELADVYRQSRFVAGLRRTEGFELPVYEGLACGARPIVFDQHHYSHWLGKHALYVVEEDQRVILETLRQCLETYAPVTTDEQRWAREFFHWKPIIEGFWERAL